MKNNSTTLTLPLPTMEAASFVLLQNPSDPGKIATAGNMTLEDEARREMFYLGDKLVEDAINLIIQNPQRLASMQEFKSYLKDEVNDVVNAITKCDIHLTKKETYDLQVKLFALSYLSKNIVNIKRFGV